MSETNVKPQMSTQLMRAAIAVIFSLVFLLSVMSLIADSSEESYDYDSDNTSYQTESPF
ncbi:hypothetical protein [Vibrio caribbeanicus]|uniref:hypothetical protein n=1 Tax=Vibrio caribbeanicus TaxID=701175 RepID=UPI0030D8313B